MRGLIFSMLLMPFLLAFSPSSARKKDRVATLTSFDYSKKNDQTTYTVFPYGSIKLAGKWRKQAYYDVAMQQRMISPDSISLGVTFAGCTSFQFSRDTVREGGAFTRAFYKWEADYFTSIGFQPVILEQDSTASYILWQVSGMSKGTAVTNYFLISAQGCRVRNIQLFGAPKFTSAEKIAFLKSLIAPFE